MITYQEGDLFENIKESSNIIIPHVCNDIGKFHAGFVIPLAKAFPVARQAYLDWYAGMSVYDTGGLNKKPKTFALGSTQFVDVSPGQHQVAVVANMCAQHGVGGASRPLRYDALVHCMEAVANYIAKNDGMNNIHAPLFGSQLAGGRFDFIAELIQDIWIRNGCNVTIHYLPGTLPEGIVI